MSVPCAVIRYSCLDRHCRQLLQAIKQGSEKAWRIKNSRIDASAGSACKKNSSELKREKIGKYEKGDESDGRIRSARIPPVIVNTGKGVSKDGELFWSDHLPLPIAVSFLRLIFEQYRKDG